MTLDEIAAHFAYNRWANDRTIGALRTLSAEQLHRPLGSSFPSLRDTIAHLASAEWIWLRRWLGDSPATPPDWVKTAMLDEVATQLDAVETARGQFVSGLTAADLARPLRYRLFNGAIDTQPLDAQMLHVVNHSSYHRGQVAGMIRQVGGTPVSTDLIAFRRLLHPAT